MNWWLIFITFLAVNLDFFVMLLTLLNRYRVSEVLVGYLLALILILGISFFAGQMLAIFLPEWILGLLGFLPIYMALHDNDEEASAGTKGGPIITTLITYLAVCAGCNLSIFLPVLAGLTINQFLLALCLIELMAVMAVIVINLFGSLPVINQWLTKYSEPLMKVIYIGVGLYVFWDSGLIRHLWKLLV